MRPDAGLRLLLLLPMLLFAGCGDAPGIAPLSPDGVILAFGDSLTAGNGAPESGSYPSQLGALLGRPVVNAGISGEVSAEGRARLAALLDQHRPELLLLCHGGNDLLQKLPLSGLEENLRAMIAMARERAVPVVLLGVPDPGIFLSDAEVYDTVARDTGVVFIPDLVSDVLSDPALKSDQVHPNQAGYRRMAEAIGEELRARGAI